MPKNLDFNDFKTLMLEYMSDFFDDWQDRHKEDSNLFPLSLPSFSDWEDQFRFFLDTNLVMGVETNGSQIN